LGSVARRVGNRQFMGAFKGSLKAEGVNVTNPQALRNFFRQTMTSPTGHISFVEAGDLESKTSLRYWKSLARILRNYFSRGDYLFVTLDAEGMEKLMRWGIAEESVVIVPQAFIELEGEQKIYLDLVQEDSTIFDFVNDHSSLSLHAPSRFEIISTGNTIRALREAAKAVQKIQTILSNLPLNDFELKMIDKVTAAVLSAA